MARLEDLPLVSAPGLTAAQMAEIDRAATDEYRIPVAILMENASRGIANAARMFLGGAATRRRIVALAGPGNNGGDALAAARHLYNWGADVSCVLAQPAERLRDLARRQYESLAPLRIPFAEREAALADAELLLDGLLGYSVSGPPRGAVAALIESANRSGVPIIAIDLPSGLDPDSGEDLAPTIRATVTVTLALPKIGLLRESAHSFVGRLVVADISVPPEAYARFGIDARDVFAASDLVSVRGARG